MVCWVTPPPPIYFSHSFHTWPARYPPPGGFFVFERGYCMSTIPLRPGIVLCVRPTRKAIDLKIYIIPTSYINRRIEYSISCFLILTPSHSGTASQAVKPATKTYSGHQKINPFYQEGKNDSRTKLFPSNFCWFLFVFFLPWL